MSGGAFEQLKRRGFISQCSDEAGLSRLLDQEQVTFYIGFDPTASSLHVGNLLQLFSMSHLQRAGHRAIALIGAGTCRIGDPSGKSESRPILSVETIDANAERFQTQIGRFLDFSEGRGMMLNNADWLAGLNYIDFLRQIGRHFSVNRMLSFETYKMRLETGLSFIEFNYQVLQAYDYLVLFQRHGCRLQMGGDDQWGNIVAGMDLIRRVEGGEAFALTTPLVTRSDGQKMGKSEKGALYLDPDLVSPYEFYQYWLNIPDADVGRFLRLFTYLDLAEIAELERLKDRETNKAKERLAMELTGIVHGAEEARKACDASRALFQPGHGHGAALEAMPSGVLSWADLSQGKGIASTTMWVMSGLVSSTSEARRLITQGGAAINGKKVESVDYLVTPSDLRIGPDGRQELMLQAGKKRFFRFIVE
jgi:tyrosyl-tRNA synthetase